MLKQLTGHDRSGTDKVNVSPELHCNVFRQLYRYSIAHDLFNVRFAARKLEIFRKRLDAGAFLRGQAAQLGKLPT